MTTPTPLTGVSGSIAELLRRVEITCKARYHASRRLSIHGWFSQWTLALLAIGQIVIALIMALKLHMNYREQYMDFGSVFFGVMVLAYSLLLGMANFSARAVLIHECGLELGRLARHLFSLRSTGAATQADYDSCAKTYYDILDKHENHTRTDYLTAHYEYYDALAAKLAWLSMPWLVERSRLIGVRMQIYVFHTLQFSHYVISTLLIYVWILVCVWGPAA
jgi:SMODS and SLOG-associating 2TM effector domain family 5